MANPEQLKQDTHHEADQQAAAFSSDPNLEHRIKERQWEFAQERGIFKGVWLAKLIYPAEMIDVENQVRFES